MPKRLANAAFFPFFIAALALLAQPVQQHQPLTPEERASLTRLLAQLETADLQHATTEQR